MKKKIDAAFDSGKKAQAKGAMRVSPFDEVKEVIDGRRVDVTDQLDQAWFAGYDALQKSA